VTKNPPRKRNLSGSLLEIRKSRSDIDQTPGIDPDQERRFERWNEIEVDPGKGGERINMKRRMEGKKKEGEMRRRKITGKGEGRINTKRRMAIEEKKEDEMTRRMIIGKRKKCEMRRRIDGETKI